MANPKHLIFEEDEIKCPHCGSTDIRANKETGEVKCFGCKIPIAAIPNEERSEWKVVVLVPHKGPHG